MRLRPSRGLARILHTLRPPVLMAVALVPLAVSSCAGAVQSPTPMIIATIRITAAPEAAGLVSEIADSFAKGNRGVTIVFESDLPGDSLAAFTQRQADVAATANVSGLLGAGWMLTEIARQPMSVIIHPDNPIKTLTLDELADIYAGRVTDWSKTSGADPIMVLGRDPSAPVRRRMDEILLGEGGKLTPHALLLPSDEAMIVTVARRPEAIGYMVGSGVFSSVKTITVEGEQPSGLARGRAYPLWQSISLITSASPSPAVAALLSYARGRQGQRIVSAWGYGQGGDSR